MHHYKAFFVLFLVSSANWIPSAMAEDHCIVRFNRDDFSQALDALNCSASSFDIVSSCNTDSTIEVRLTSNDYTRLCAQTNSHKLIVSASRYRELRIDDQYLDPSEVSAQSLILEQTYPSIVKRYRIGNTHEGRDIWALKISDSVAIDEDEPGILITGLLQAREIMGVEIAMDLAQYLASNYASSPTVRNWVNNLEIWVVPLLNPDGNLYCWNSDPYWIKNRRDNGDGSFGVDLGHNYPYRWGECFGSADFPSSDAYRGPFAGSEPEVQAIINLVEAQSINAALSYNSFNELVLMPYGCHGDYPSAKTAVRNIGTTVASAIQCDSGAMGYGFGTWWEKLYPNDGVDTDWLYATHGILNYAIEVNTSYLPAYSIRNQTVQRNRPGWQALFDAVLVAPQIRGHVRDACSQDAVDAIIDIIELPLNPGELPRRADPQFGRYQRFVSPGTYTVRASADGYASVEHQVTLTANPVDLDFDIIPLTAYGLVYHDHIVDDIDGDHDFNLDPGEETMLGIALTAPGLGVTGISGHLSTSDAYITIVDGEATFPDLATGWTGWAQGDCYRISAHEDAPENHHAILSLELTTQEELCISTIDFEIVVQGYSYQCPIWVNYLDQNPHWTIVNGDSYGWEFGVPIIGPSDPFSGQYVYGTNLDGNYSVGPYRLTTTPIDCSTILDTELKYHRFLQNEEFFDLARVDLSTNGTSWHTLWSGYASDFDWVEEDIDISEYADGEPSVWIRFSLIPDSNSFYPGFYIDDVMICGLTEGMPVPPPTQTPFPSGTVPATSTPSPSPSTATQTPVFSPTPTPSPSPTTETPTATPAPHTSTPTCTPTPDDDSLELDLLLNNTDFSQGDLFKLELIINWNGESTFGDLYILLDVYGSYFFHPTWTQTPECETLDLIHGFSSHRNILSFVWPENTGSASNIVFWTGCVEHASADLLGPIDHVTFNYH